MYNFNSFSAKSHMVCENLVLLRILCMKSRSFPGKFTQLAKILHNCPVVTVATKLNSGGMVYNVKALLCRIFCWLWLKMRGEAVAIGGAEPRENQDTLDLERFRTIFFQNINIQGTAFLADRRGLCVSFLSCLSSLWCVHQRRWDNIWLINS